jgi:hypothetical protein
MAPPARVERAEMSHAAKPVRVGGRSATARRSTTAVMLAGSTQCRRAAAVVREALIGLVSVTPTQ